MKGGSLLLAGSLSCTLALAVCGGAPWYSYLLTTLGFLFVALFVLKRCDAYDDLAGELDRLEAQVQAQKESESFVVEFPGGLPAAYRPRLRS